MPKSPAEKAQESGDVKVFIVTREAACEKCKEDLGRKAWIFLDEKRVAHCLDCAGIGSHEFLPSGDQTLTRRARKHSGLDAVVLKWSTARKRYERQGVLVEEEALEKAKEECEADADKRAAKRKTSTARREKVDKEYIKRFAERIREIFPGCPRGREQLIADHACRKHSDRIGRSAAAKELDEDAVTLAVEAHVRHAETHYDDLIGNEHDRREARRMVRAEVDEVLSKWRKKKG